MWIMYKEWTISASFLFSKKYAHVVYNSTADNKLNWMGAFEVSCSSRQCWVYDQTAGVGVGWCTEKRLARSQLHTNNVLLWMGEIIKRRRAKESGEAHGNTAVVLVDGAELVVWSRSVTQDRPTSMLNTQQSNTVYPSKVAEQRDRERTVSGYCDAMVTLLWTVCTRWSCMRCWFGIDQPNCCYICIYKIHRKTTHAPCESDRIIKPTCTQEIATQATQNASIPYGNQHIRARALTQTHTPARISMPSSIRMYCIIRWCFKVDGWAIGCDASVMDRTAELIGSKQQASPEA